MNDFTASNGIELRIAADLSGQKFLSGTVPNEQGPVGFTPTLHATASEEGMVALREFFRAETDEHLNRWRDPAQPEFVVYAIPGEESRVIVLDETTGLHYGASRESARNGNGSAAHYFDAHPEPNPAWFAAEEGDVWIITHDGIEYPAIFQAERFRDHGGSWGPGDITEARRIYPEVSS